MADVQDGPSLAEPYARLVRAREHVNSLHHAAQALIDGESYSVANNGEPEDGWETLVFQVREDPPLALSVILSDALHNWRAALDNLVCQLVRLNGGKIGTQTGFPVIPNRKAFRKRGLPKLYGMAERHKRAIGELQPYPGRNSPRVQAIEWVHALAKDDRHQALHPTFASQANVEMPFTFVHVGDGPPATVDVRLLAKGKRLEHGTPLAQLRIKPPPSNPDVKVRAEPLMEIAFGERGLRLYGIPQLGIEIGEVVRSFAPDFPD